MRAPSCAPCPRADVPPFDRWAIREPRQALDVGGSVLALGLAAFTWVDALDQGSAGRAEIAASVQSAAWAVGIAELLKAVAARSRPVMFTDGAAAEALNLDSQRSWPSVHAAGAAAIATSYVMGRPRLHTPKARLWMIVGAAATVGGLRVVSGRHFPSDVVSGAAIGIGSAMAVHAIKF